MRSASALSGLLCASLLTACGGEDPNGETETTGSESATDTAGTDEAEGAEAESTESTDTTDEDTTDEDTTDEDTGGAFTWETDASAFFETYCWECHGPGDTMRDYSELSAVMAESATIRCGVASATVRGCTTPPPQQFPVGSGPKPSDEERDAIVAWIEAGTP